jgi:hypothetical protein
LNDAPWCAHRIIRHIDDVKADPKYSKSAREDLRATLSYKPAADDSREDIYTSKDGNIYTALWEIYDAKKGRIYTIAEGNDVVLRDDRDELSHLGFPFHVVVFNPDNDHFWGISDAHNIEALQLELNEIKEQDRQQRRASLLRFLYKKGSIDKEEMDKFMSEENCIGIATNGDPRECIVAFQAHPDMQLEVKARGVREDIREVIGFNRNFMGEYDDSSRRTATEAQIVAQAAGIRIDERRDVNADTLTELTKGINATIMNNWSEEHVTQIVGPDGARYWVQYKGEDLKGDYLYRIDPDSALPVTAQTRKKEAQELFAQLKGDPTVNQTELKRFLVSQYEGADVEAIMQPNMVMPMAGGMMPINALAMQLAQKGMMPGANVPVQM